MTDTMAPSPVNHAAEAPLLLPENPPRLGPRSRRLLMRAAIGLLVVEATGAFLTFVVGSDTARAIGLSLVFPGGGFLYTAWPLLFAVSCVLLLVALVLWWGASFHAAIPLVWFGGAVVAATLADGPRLFVERGTVWVWTIAPIYALAIGFVGMAVYRFERDYRTKRAQIPELNKYLRSAPAPAERFGERPPDEMDIELLRWAYSIATQPDDELIGLDWGDQFHSGTQLRYQLNALCWALSMYAVNFVPNAPGQLEDAVARLILKHTDLRVWGYWRTLNVLGNFDANPDPIVRDNIMFSAFFADVINVFEAATGSARFDEPGSLTFVSKDGRTFEYDHHSIVEAVARNFERSKLGFFPCEPGWAFTVCNIMGAQSLLGHDTLHGTDNWRAMKPRWVDTLDGEYLTPDGSYAHIKSSHLGLSWDTGEAPNGHYFTNGTNRFADILPDHARRAAALERRTAEAKIRKLESLVVNGHLDLELPEELERNRVLKNALGGWNKVIGGCRMIGAEALFLAALDASARQCATGERWPDRPLDASVSAVGGQMMLRWSAPRTAAELNVGGYRAPVGPVLAEAPWKQVLITEARSPDALGLELRLEPISADDAGATELAFGQLVPGMSYRLQSLDSPVALGASIVADDMGSARVNLSVDRPMSLVLEPSS